MKYRILNILLFLTIVLSFSGKVYSQIDSLIQKENIYSLEFLSNDNRLIEEKNIRVISLDSGYVTFVSLFYNDDRVWQDTAYTVRIESIRSFGYKVGASFGTRLGSGALIGFSAGFILGVTYDRKPSLEPSSESPSFFGRLGFGVVLGLVTAIPGALIGALSGIGAKEYEVLNVSKYGNSRKYEIIKRLIDTGLKKNK